MARLRMPLGDSLARQQNDSLFRVRRSGRHDLRRVLAQHRRLARGEARRGDDRGAFARWKVGAFDSARSEVRADHDAADGNRAAVPSRATGSIIATRAGFPTGATFFSGERRRKTDAALDAVDRRRCTAPDRSRERQRHARHARRHADPRPRAIASGTSSRSTAARPVPPLEPNDVPMRFTDDGKVLYVATFGKIPSVLTKVDLASGTREKWREVVPADAAGTSVPRGRPRMGRRSCAAPRGCCRICIYSSNSLGEGRLGEGRF